MSKGDDSQEQAAIAAFEADPFDWVLDWAVDDHGQVKWFLNELRVLGLGAEPLPAFDHEEVYDRIVPPLFAELQDQGLLSNHAGCTIRYVWSGVRCSCARGHAGMELPSDEDWPAVIQPPARRQALFTCDRGHVTPVVLPLGIDMMASWYCDVCSLPTAWTSGLRPGTRFRGWQPDQWSVDINADWEPRGF